MPQETKMRLMNDDEFAHFTEVGTTDAWGRVIEAVMRQSPYGDYGDHHAVYLYSSRVFHPDFDNQPELLPTDREYWNAPNRCDWTTPLFLHIAKQAMPEYNWKQYRHFKTVDRPGSDYHGEQFGHTECIGVCTTTGEPVALGLNVDDVSTFDLCNYPNDPIDADSGVQKLYQVAIEQPSADG
jgi:hypothetical protein